MKKVIKRWTIRVAAAMGLAALMVGCGILDSSAPPGNEVVLNQPAPAGGRALREVRTDRARYAVARSAVLGKSLVGMMVCAEQARPPYYREGYEVVEETGFRPALEKPLSTFSTDVDTASYANTRRFIHQHQAPPRDAVRIEELINYFSYDYPEPDGSHPLALVTEMAACPWNTGHQLALVGLQTRRLDTEALPPNQLTFLIDVSGSMNHPAKLPLLKRAMRLLVEQMRPRDRVALVVYAGAAGVVLEATPGDEKGAILEALERLEAGGSTAGKAGLELAYDVARRQFDAEANNRVILATDGDFNVGPSSDAELVRYIESRRDEGIYLTVLGFGSGNYQDAKMEKLADKGNGNYAYIDSILEARKALVEEMGATLFTVARDVKLQVEFNPAAVKAYRLIGYENRALADEDFNDDRKDAGELGAGHSVTALYEIIPAGSDEAVPGIDPLKYQRRETVPSKEWMTVKVRYKKPGAEESVLLSRAVEQAGTGRAPSPRFAFASAVAEFGLLLRASDFRGQASFPALIARARGALGRDAGGYRAEFVRLAEQASLLTGEAL